MEELGFWQILLGHYSWETYIAGIWWALVGALFVKSIYFERKKALASGPFKLIKFWLNDNLTNIINVIIACMVIIRLGDYAVHFFEEWSGKELPEIDDFIVVVMVISGFIQWWRHKYRSPISKAIATEMHVHNEECEHTPIK